VTDLWVKSNGLDRHRRLLLKAVSNKADSPVEGRRLSQSGWLVTWWGYLYSPTDVYPSQN